ncbi:MULTISPECIES: N-6 DNA methylase [Micromonospora]|uniref:N-6 DNA methylase n=1 Tax=Micromonospora TaxID=1873 RepID=UPI0027DC254D|nr:N-6 DNA methylase [Micromonospora sp. C41]
MAYEPQEESPGQGFSPRTEPELAWVQHALAHLSPGGTAVVLMPPAAASRPAGRRVRAELIRRGALRAVVALPAGLMPPTAIGLHIWVLMQPDAHLPPTGGLLVVDTTAALPERTLLNIVDRPGMRTCRVSRLTNRGCAAPYPSSKRLTIKST